MNETTQQEKTTQLGSRNEQLNSAAGTKQLNLVSRNETTQLCTAVDRLQPPTTACNRLHRLHRLYSRIGFFSTYLYCLIFFQFTRAKNGYTSKFSYK
ncbi:hypothetical protein TNCV_4571771 [Trichonephila clavipes]|nr:hypothetical protein TNCV_4571771 [Trichonephila clavipes]